MSITGIQLIQSVYGPSASSAAFAQRAETPRESDAPQTDTVLISQEARNRAMNPADTTASKQDLPLEAYSLPGWYGELRSDLTLVDAEVGIPYAESRAARYDALSSREKSDLAEYHGKLHSFFQEELSARGIESSEDYYAQIVKDPIKSEEIHQAVRQKLESDARAVHLAEYFGITL